MGGLRPGASQPVSAAPSQTLETTIGLEIHVELDTASKMFCGCEVGFGGEPNTRTCPVCLGLPGSLPVVNERAIEFTTMIGLVFDCSIAKRSLFARKNYFYPDMPKNYQITQYELPLATQGHLSLEGESGPVSVGITRVHLEEDTGGSLHVGGSGRIADSEYSLEDYNRAGTPLVEIVTEPDLHTAEHARLFVAELRAIVEALGVSDVRMEQGSLRVDANISVRRVGEAEHGAKVEVKNMNSIRSVGRALEHEEERQRNALEAGETLVQETRHFDEKTGTTSSLRTKEYAFDYRYFPEPDLVPFEPAKEWVEALRDGRPELPAERRVRWEQTYGLPSQDAAILASSKATAAWFEAAASAYGGDAKRIVNWIIADLFGLLNEAGATLTACKIAPAQLAGLVGLVDDGTISGKQAKEVLGTMFASGDDAAKIVRDKGLEQESDTEVLEAVVEEVIAENADAADKVRAGQANTIGFLVGRVMRKTGGSANPKLVTELLRDKLAG
ncbi:MAG: Asp-tRNA(Asn)/Glu-tRNA(Gln) amidotransferase subunit GatB [Actinobacteria bacterium]|nr:Asp-tRNA(Asn)/Glu-tRNA(Gln) amidotransferase subunit GatB [Actinomycetota bacterium]